MLHNHLIDKVKADVLVILMGIHAIWIVFAIVVWFSDLKPIYKPIYKKFSFMENFLDILTNQNVIATRFHISMFITY